MDIELRVDEYLAMGEKPAVTYRTRKGRGGDRGPAHAL